jgi:hypothetical protein
LFAVAPEQGLLATKTEPIESLLQVKPQAPVSDIGFYSATEQAALNLGRNKGTGQSFINDLMKSPDVKKEELQFTGLDEFLRDKPNVTKQEVQDFLANNRVDVKEVTYGSQDFSKLPDTQLQNEYVRVRGYKPVDNYGDVMSREEIISELSGAQADDLTKYSRYQLAGGENYREILLTLPAKRLSEDEARKVLGAKPEAKLSEADISYASRKAVDEYKSTHFDQANILAHIRVNDRVDADGKKMLLIEEVQSDWHQAGREKGYKGKGTLTELPDNYFVQELKTIDGDTMYVVRDNSNPSVIINKDYNRQSAINGVINELNATSAGGVPDAPFKDTWYQLALKRALRYAADNGYDRVGLTTGKQQAERYDLSKQIGQINARPTPDGKISLEALTPDMGEQVIQTVVKADELDNIVGKEIADKIRTQIEYPKSFDDLGKSVELSGLDLKVGGEGMKKYYDDVYPKFLEKYGKKWGASVGETQIKTGRGVPGGEPVRFIDITPEMRKSVKKGQPLAAVSSDSTVA